MHLFNVMETLVMDVIDEMVKQKKLCDCPRCRLDTAAIALNNLPPVYVVTAEGQSIKSNFSQYRIDAMRMVAKAVEVVKHQPHH